MKTSASPADLRKLAALTAFLTQKALLLAGGALFEERPPELAALAQKRSQIDRLHGELRSQAAACGPLPPAEASQVEAVRSLGDGLQALGREAEALARAIAAEGRPESRLLERLHGLYEASAILAAQAVGAVAEQDRLHLGDAARNLRRNRDHLASLEAGLPPDAVSLPAAAPVRNVSRHARALADAALRHLSLLAPAPLFPADGDGKAAV